MTARTALDAEWEAYIDRCAQRLHDQFFDQRWRLKIVHDHCVAMRRPFTPAGSLNVPTDPSDPPPKP